MSECFCSYQREGRGGDLFEVALVPNPDCPTHGTEEVGPEEGLQSGDRHIYDGERCIHCHVNIYDDGIYGPFDCVDRAPHNHTSETPAP